MFWKAKNISVALFILPLALALYCGFIIHAILIVGVIIFSFLFHYHEEKKWRAADQLFAFGLISYNLYILALSGFAQPYTLLVASFVALAFFFFFRSRHRNYSLNHSLWHLSSVIITILCILAYSLNSTV